ncbi:pyrroloquinoline quinone-dependent dehydrogenase [Segetibacter koreensis]|uniref:pyrroloquinoline quinone-dependent dehydrogenase n=1 Tax=Segetibacter koreensis TaxID=398037 RepID=UPI00036FC1F0|nr:pyrroloquinoline quinone-dependent dehydrogenase [Segetibacter koreensis]
MKKASFTFVDRMFIKPKTLFVSVVLLQLMLSACTISNRSTINYAGKNWNDYAGDNTKSRYSTLSQVNKQNVSQLKVAWTYRSGDYSDDLKTTIECNPVAVNGVVYASTPTLKLVALQAATGKEIWRFDPLPPEVLQKLRTEEKIDITPGTGYWVNRGVKYWESGKNKRIYYSAGIYLFALNAQTGKPISNFGNNGKIDLRQGLNRDIKGMHYNSTTPGVVYKNNLIMGSTVGEGPEPAAPGFVRAFDIETGKLNWVFHTIPQSGEFGNDTWGNDSWKKAGGVNAWSGISLDEKRGIAFIATGSPTWDFYGQDRPGNNLFGNCVVALDANTGKRMWHFQTVHHDIWDKDVPCPPNLVTVKHNGKKIDAVAQVSKTGYVYLFNRETGKPLFEIEEKAVPASNIPGEHTSATQPVPIKPKAFARTGLTVNDMTNLNPEAHTFAIDVFKKSKSGPQFTPISNVPTLIMPGLLGGANWSGASFDPETNLLYVNSNDLPSYIGLIHNESGKPYPYKNTGYNRFWDPQGYPAITPPWGSLTAINLNTGDFAWQVTLGEFDELTKKGIPPTGSPNLGGSIVTAGGLVFIASTKDEKFRAFDKQTGKILWETKLPAGGYSSPSTYLVDGKQYIIIAAGGGGKMATKSGDYYIAFALP